MRWLLIALIVLSVALLAEAVLDSALGAWVAVGVLFALVAVRLLGFGSDFGADD